MKVKQSRGDLIFDAVNTVLMLGIVYLVLMPFWQIAIGSISDPQLVLAGRIRFIPHGFTLDNYRYVFRTRDVITAYKNTLLYTSLGTAISIVLTVTMAYPLSRREFLGRSVYMKLVTFTLLFNGGLIPTFLVILGLGMYNTTWAIVIPSAISAWNLIIARTFFMSIPREMEESAVIDGANDLQIFFWISLPLSKAIIATLTLFIAVGFWNDYFTPLIYLNENARYPMTIYLRSVISAARIKDVEMASDIGTGKLISISIKYTVIMISTLPIIFIYPFLQKYFVKGVMIGSIKG